MEKETIWASVVSEVGANVLFHPLDTLRVIHQTSPLRSVGKYWLWPPSRYWQGLVPAVVLGVPAFVIDISVYREAKRWYGENSISSYLLAGALAQIASSVLWTPTDILSGRLQLRRSSDLREKSLLNEIRTIWRTEGVRGFYRGYWLGLAIYLPYQMTWWATYDEMKPHVGVPLASALATVAGETLSNLFSLVKVRVMLASSPDLHGLRPTDKLGVRHVLANLVQEGGVFRALVRGLHIRLFTAIPMSVFSMVMLERLSPDKVNSKTPLRGSDYSDTKNSEAYGN